MSRLARVTLFLLGLAVPQLCRAQALPLGRWTGSALAMDEPAEPLTFDVTAVGDSLRIILHAKTGGDYRLDTVRLNGDTLRFTLHLARALPQGDAPGGAHGARCLLLHQPDGSYAGTCTGSNGMPSTMRMVPPQ